MRSRTFRAPLALALALAPAALHAQSPVVTPNGDPSVQPDSIYRLAVDSADYPDNSTALLLDDGIIRLQANGQSTETFRQITQILKTDAVDDYSEYTFTWDADRDSLRLNWARVVKPDGSVVSAKPLHEQEFDVPAAEDDPVYTHNKEIRISLSGVAPGTIVDVSTTRKEFNPAHKGDYYTSWLINTTIPTARSRFVLDVPASLRPHIVEKNLKVPRTEDVVNGRRVYTWFQADVPRIVPEAFAAVDSSDVIQSVTASIPITWDNVATWYDSISHDRYELTPAIRAKEKEILDSAKTRADTLHALYRWVAQDVRYVSLDLGEGGYVPRKPGDVFSSGAGDCKDKTTLFVALARDAGYRADPVLVESSGGMDPDFPSILQFDHMIAAVARPTGGYDFLELTSNLDPYGQIVPSYQNGWAVIVHRNGHGEVVRLPADSAQSSQIVTKFVGTLDTVGGFHGTVTETGTGAEQFTLRRLFKDPLSEKDANRFAVAVASRLINGAQGSDLVYSNGRDLKAPARMSVHIDGGQAARAMADGSMVFTLPIERWDLTKLIARVQETAGKRIFPIDMAAVVGPVTIRTGVCVTLPQGWTPELPADVHAKSAFGTYDGEYSFKNGTLCAQRAMSGWRGVAPASKVDDLMDWMRGVDKDDVSFIMLKRPSAHPHP